MKGLFTTSSLSIGGTRGVKLNNGKKGGSVVWDTREIICVKPSRDPIPEFFTRLFRFLSPEEHKKSVSVCVHLPNRYKPGGCSFFSGMWGDPAISSRWHSRNGGLLQIPSDLDRMTVQQTCVGVFCGVNVFSVGSTERPTSDTAQTLAHEVTKKKVAH